MPGMPELIEPGQGGGSLDPRSAAILGANQAAALQRRQAAMRFGAAPTPPANPTPVPTPQFVPGYADGTPDVPAKPGPTWAYPVPAAIPAQAGAPTPRVPDYAPTEASEQPGLVRLAQAANLYPRAETGTSNNPQASPNYAPPAASGSLGAALAPAAPSPAGWFSHLFGGAPVAAPVAAQAPMPPFATAVPYLNPGHGYAPQQAPVPAQVSPHDLAVTANNPHFVNLDQGGQPQMRLGYLKDLLSVAPQIRPAKELAAAQIYSLIQARLSKGEITPAQAQNMLGGLVAGGQAEVMAQLTGATPQ